MMGTKERMFAPLVAVSLEALVPQDHFYRHLDRVLDLSFVRELVQDTYAARGRPSIDPVIFFRLQLVMFFEDIRSERLLMRLVADKLSVRWFLGYDLNEPLPDHSSLTRIRTRYGIAVFRRFFEAIVEQCQAAGLVWGKELYLDATKVQANAAMDSLTPRFALERHLAGLFPAESPNEPCVQASARPGAQLADPPHCLPAEAPPLALPTNVSPDTATELSHANARRHDWIAQVGRPDPDIIRGHYQRISTFRVSTTDPDATVMQTKGGSHLGYHTHYVVDGGKARVILAALVTPSEVMENQPALDLIWWSCFHWKLRPRHVTGDTTYGTREVIAALEQQHLRAYMPLPNTEERTPFFGKQRFRYDSEQDVYWCPADAVLRLYTYVTSKHAKWYRADAATCNACALKAQCTPGKSGRRLERSLDEEDLDRVRGYHQTEAYHKAMRKRQVWVEPLFAEAKDWHGMRRFRLRLLWRVNCEALVTAAGQNIKRLLQKRGWGRRPIPGGAAGEALFLRLSVSIESLLRTLSRRPIVIQATGIYDFSTR